MSNEEFDRKMEFIVEQQAQFVADIQVMREVHAADVKLLKEQDRKLSDALATAAELVGGLAAAQTRTDAKLAESNARTDAKLAESNARADAKLAELSERLNIFISVVERHLGGNGGSSSSELPQ